MTATCGPLLSEQALQALDGVLTRLERPWRLHPPDTTEFHAYDPLPLGEWLPGIALAMEHAPVRTFLDVGCGIGTKLAFMYHHDYRVTGIERHLPYVEAVRELVQEATIVHADARDVEDFDAGIVYMYRPMIGDDDELELERHVAARLAPGTVLFLPVRPGDACAEFERLGPAVWRVP